MNKFLNPKRRKNDIPKSEFLEFIMTMRKVNGECWEWTGGTSPRGYGIVRLKDKIWRVHRLVWTLTKGPIPDGKEICHTCDNPPCFNPAHLFQGTHTDNMRDALQKNRLKPSKGEAHGCAKLTNEQVKSIRAMYVPRVVTRRAIAKLFGVSYNNICMITRKQAWKHI